MRKRAPEERRYLIIKILIIIDALLLIGAVVNIVINKQYQAFSWAIFGVNIAIFVVAIIVMSIKTAKDVKVTREEDTEDIVNYYEVLTGRKDPTDIRKQPEEPVDGYIICPNCKTKRNRDERVCKYCGERLIQDIRFEEYNENEPTKDYRDPKDYVDYNNKDNKI